VRENVTGRPDDAAAASTYGEPPTSGEVGEVDVKTIAWTLNDKDPPPTANDCVACGAARKLASPSWFASTVQLPAPTKEIIEPSAEQTPTLPGSIENSTGRPELAVAATAYGEPPIAADAGGGEVNAIVCVARAGGGGGTGTGLGTGTGAGFGFGFGFGDGAGDGAGEGGGVAGDGDVVGDAVGDRLGDGDCGAGGTGGGGGAADADVGDATTSTAGATGRARLLSRATSGAFAAAARKRKRSAPSTPSGVLRPSARAAASTAASDA
jgi:hypothetical protein